MAAASSHESWSELCATGCSVQLCIRALRFIKANKSDCFGDGSCADYYNT
jgi:hypothetical protein